MPRREDDDGGRSALRRGDAFARAGDTASAVREYLSYCDAIERFSSTQHLKAAAVRKQVLELMPERRDVRRALAENYVALGLVEDARGELRRLAREWETMGEKRARAEVLARLEEIG